MKKIALYILLVISGILIGIICNSCFNKTNIKLLNGKEVIISVKGKEITAEEIFEETKRISGLQISLDLVDRIILKDIYNLTDEDNEKINGKMKDMYDLYKNSYGYNKKEFLEANGFISEEHFQQYMESEYLHELYFYDYLKKSVTKKEINDYYDKYVFGAKRVYMYSSGEKSDLDIVTKYLKKGKSFSYIEKHTKNIVCEDLGYLDFHDNLEEVLLTTIKNTKKGKYSKVIDIDSYGFAIIYVADTKKVLSLDELRDDIIEKIVKKKVEEENEEYYKAFIELRKKYEMTIYDSELKKNYNNFIKSVK